MATITDMGIPGDSLGGSGILQPFHKNRWRLEFKGMGSGEVSSLTGMCITAERPQFEYDEIQLDRYNSRAYLQGKYTFQPISVVLQPDIGGAVHRAIQSQTEKQQRLIAAQDGNFLGQAISGQAYKFSINMDMLDGDHDGLNILETWRLEGCALNNVDYGDLDYQASEALTTTLQIRFDHAYQEITGTVQNATGGQNG